MQFIVNLIILLIIGFIIGSERAKTHNVIGVRTISLILIGSFLFTYISTKIGGDPARIIAQIVTGTGFISAGVIFKQGIRTIANLTTAVLIWVLSAVGCLLALNMVAEAIFISIVIYFILKTYKKIV